MIKNKLMLLTNSNKAVLLKKKNFLFFSQKNYCYAGLATNSKTDPRYLYLDKENTNLVRSALDQPLLIKHKLKQQREILFSFLFFFFLKCKFKGKGYKIKKVLKLKVLKMYFGYSHFTMFFSGATVFRKIKKFKYILLSTNLKNISYTAKLFANVQALNAYTKRGLRLSRQLTCKRPGKKKTY